MKKPTTTYPLYQSVGRLIKMAREAQGLTQADLGNKVSMRRTSIAAIECGAQQLLTHQFVDIALALGYTPWGLYPMLLPEYADGPIRAEPMMWDGPDFII